MLRQAGGQVDRGGGLADAALLVGDRHDPAALGPRPVLPLGAATAADCRLGGAGDRRVTRSDRRVRHHYLAVCCTGFRRHLRLLRSWGLFAARHATTPVFHVKPPPRVRSVPGRNREAQILLTVHRRTSSRDLLGGLRRGKPQSLPGHPSPVTPGIRAAPPSGHPTPAALSTCSLLSAVSSHDDTDNRGRRYDPTVTGLQNLRTPHAKSRQNGPCGRQFGLGGLSLDREQLTTGAQQRCGPADQPVERRHRARRGHVRPDRAAAFPPPGRAPP